MDSWYAWIRPEVSYGNWKFHCLALPASRFLILRCRSGNLGDSSNPRNRYELLYFGQMASLNVSLPDDLASQIRAQEEELPRILELGVRELNAGAQFGFDGAADALELLAGLPAPEQIVNLRPSPRLAAKVAELIEKSRSGMLSSADEGDWERYEYLEHLVRIRQIGGTSKTCVRR